MASTNNKTTIPVDRDASQLNEAWEMHIKNKGADFVYFVDITTLPEETREDYNCAVFFGKVLSREYLRAIRDGNKPEKREFENTEQRMDKLAVKLTEELSSEGYKSISKIKFARLPHKTVARMAGFGFIGKNTLLINEQYGSAVVLGKVLTTTPFITTYKRSITQQCGDCTACIDVCPTNALIGHTWDITTRREEMLVRKLCNHCLKCMVSCPFTEQYMEESTM